MFRLTVFLVWLSGVVVAMALTGYALKWNQSVNRVLPSVTSGEAELDVKSDANGTKEATIPQEAPREEQAGEADSSKPQQGVEAKPEPDALEPSKRAENKPETVEKPDAESKQAQSAADHEVDAKSARETPTRSAPTAVANDVQRPEFDVVRIARDGGLVVAGRVTPGADVVVKTVGGDLASTKANEAGQFAIAPTAPLSPGSYRIWIEATPQEGEPVISNQNGIVYLPKERASGNLLALVVEDDKPTRVLQQQWVDKIPDAPKADEQASLGDKPKVDQATEAKDDVEKVPAKAAEPKKLPLKVKPYMVSPNGIPASGVIIQAADIDGKKMFVAGKGLPGSQVIIYLNNDPLGSAVIDLDGNFGFEVDAVLETDKAMLRVDLINKNGDAVAARAEVEINTAIDIKKKDITKKDDENREAANGATKPVDQQAALKSKQDLSQDKTSNPKLPKALQDGAEIDELVDIFDGRIKGEPVSQIAELVLIQRGDSLWKLSHKKLGSGYRYSVIFDANRDQVRNPHLIYPGQVLRIPKLETAQTPASSATN